MSNEKLDVSSVIGRLGWYQFVVIMLTILRAFPTSWTLTSIDFLAGDVDHWCSPPEPSEAWDPDQWKKDGVPYIDEKHSKCLRYVTDGQSILTNETVACDRWEYEAGAPSSSVVDWDLVCSRSWMRSTMQSVAFVGQLIGALFIGHLSDKYGRKFMLEVSTVSMFMFGCVASWSPSVHVFNLLRLCQAMAASGLQTTTATLYTEICLPNERNLLNIGFSLGFTLPMMLLPFLAKSLNNWRWVQAAAGISTLLIVPCLVLTQESPRWLFSKGRMSEAKSAMQKIFRINRREVPDLEKLAPALMAKTQADNSQKSLGISDIWPHRKLRMNVFLLFVFWFFENMFYFANAFIATKLGGDRFLSFALSAAAEVPGGILSIFLIRYYPRRNSLAMILASAGIASLVLAFTPVEHVHIRLGLNMLCRFFLVMSTAIKWVYTFELLPTPARATGFAFCYCFGRLGGMVAPFMRDLADFSPPAPHLVLATASLIATTTLKFTPETLNQYLPDSFTESEQLGNTKKDQNSE